MRDSAVRWRATTNFILSVKAQAFQQHSYPEFEIWTVAVDELKHVWVECPAPKETVGTTPLDLSKCVPA